MAAVLAGVRLVVILKIKQARCALADGRLEEAFELLSDADVRSHRQGQELLGPLGQLLVQRATAHLAADRLVEASGDCEKAAAMAGSTPAIAQLRQAVGQALVARRQAQQMNGQLLAAAQKQADDGRLSVGEQLLDQAGDGGHVQALRQQLADRKVQRQAAADRAAICLRQADWDGAIEAAVAARQAGGRGQQVIELTSQVVAAVTCSAREALQAGRIDRAAALLLRLGDLAESSVTMRELLQALQQCRQAADCLKRGDARQGGLVLRQLTAILPQAAWLDAAIAQAATAAEAIDSLRAGPIGSLMGLPQRSSDVQPPDAAGANGNNMAVGAPRAVDARLARADDEAAGLAGESMPRKFFMHVDSAGSFLVLRGQRITVGPISSSPAPDLALMADPSHPSWEIQRVDEDYFLRSDRPLMVGGKATTSMLLSDGDEIQCSPRCRLRFNLPMAGNPTAVLKVTGPALPGGDCRQVILLDRDMVVGAHSQCHVRVESLSETVVLSYRTGRLLLRPWGQGDSAAGNPGAQVAVGQPVQVGHLRLVIAEK